MSLETHIADYVRCCWHYVMSHRHRWECPKCGTIWAWDDDLATWVRSTLIDGGGVDD